MAEFLPLCDLLFNVVSLAAYFCDIVFDLLMVYALYEKQMKLQFVQCLTVVLFASIVIQVLSLNWYLNNKPPHCTRFMVVILHVAQLGVVWRYARLLIPVKLTNVKNEVKDLCILRLVYGFLQAAPMLLIELSMLLSESTEGPSSDLVKVSSALSLFSICWALASFSKHVQNVDRLVLTWLGVISQLLWRAGTVSARALALSAYTISYHSWIFLVLALHWACMFLWLLSPKSTFHGQGKQRLGMCVIISAMYIIAYINIHDKPHSRTMIIFYTVMLLENSVLVGAWLATIWQNRNINWQVIPCLTVGLFGLGIFFMLIYYRFFHIKRLLEKPSEPPGVFKCRFVNPSAEALYRKKKKPTSFVPPPGLNQVSVPFWRRPLPSSSENEGSSVGSRVNIQQKLQEKKEKQLAELKIIEEEIKQGKLGGPVGVELDDRQPIPRTKHHVEPQLLSLASLNNLASYGVNLNRRPPPRAPRSRTPELLLTPRYLYCDCPIPEPEPVDPPALHPPSDLESQLSLPRSYTLPREFKYYRRTRSRRPIRGVVSTNSSDGDVDSAEESDYNSPPVPIRNLRHPYRHETRL
ncbi:XK-related protein 7 [Agrilus planipennis]|uniref:XK-related protein n=1 Tax=Agrilus planipennis TaxID=224129 RepID=A0A1W4WC01_AGRPL|nr:XK-related protein 7 [Agrilus planipennis]